MATKHVARALAVVLACCLPLPVLAFFGLAHSDNKACEQGNTVQWVTGGGECLRVITENPMQNPRALVVFLHGDISRGGHANYLADRMRELEPENNDIVAVALMRPGYEDRAGNRSSGSHNGRRDHYTRHNIKAVAEAVKQLKTAYSPRTTIIAGHSGGAAIAGVIAGKHPGVADHFVLASCPCDIRQWRRSRGRSNWDNSLSPSDYVDAIPERTRIIALSGTEDANTTPELIESFVARLKQRSLGVDHVEMDVGHNGTARESDFFAAILSLSEG